MKLEFYKYQGTGNDFILLDNRDGGYTNLTEAQVKFLCDRNFGIGADGLMLLNQKEDFDFEMVYYNSDGREGSMCGNGGRCIVSFARQMGIKKPEVRFSAIDGPHIARINLDKEISLKMNDVIEVRFIYDSFELNTGSPHYVRFVKNMEDLNIFDEGRKVRYGKDYAENGINVNFVEELEKDKIFVRTYERGVENETRSCGTGVTAAALMAAHNDNGFNRVDVETMGGKLNVEFEKINDNEFTNIWLSGPATFVFKGIIEIK